MAQAEVAKSELGVRMAQMQLYKQQRDEDYALRLEQRSLAKTENARQASVHKATMHDIGQKSIGGIVAEYQDRDGNVVIPKGGAQEFSDRFNLGLDANDEFAKAVGGTVSARSGGKYTHARLVATGPDTVAFEMYNPETGQKGVMTNEGGTGPNEVVSQFPVNQMVDTTQSLSVLKSLGATQSTLQYFLADWTGSKQAPADEQTLSQVRDLSKKTGIPLSTDTPAEDSNPASSSTPIVPAGNQPAPTTVTGRLAQVPANGADTKLNRFQYDDIVRQASDAVASSGKIARPEPGIVQSLGGNLGARVDGFKKALDISGDAISQLGSDMAGGARAIKEDFMAGFNGSEKATPQAQGETPPTTSTTAPTQEALPPVVDPKTNRIRAPEDFSAQGVANYFSKTNIGAVISSAAKESASTKRTLENMATVEHKHVKEMGRYLMVQSVKGALPPGQAATILESGRGNARELDVLALTQPSEAAFMAKFMQSGGAKALTATGREDIIKSQNNYITQQRSIVSTVNSTRDGKQSDKFDAAVIGGIDDVGAIFGSIDPFSKEDFILTHNATLVEAAGEFSRLQDKYISEGRDLRSAFAYTVMAKIRQGAYIPPNEISEPEQIEIYNKNGMEIMSNFQGDAARTEYALRIYQSAAANLKNADIDIGSIVDAVNKKYPPAK